MIVNNRRVCFPSPARETRTPSITGCISFIRMPPARLSCIVWIWRHPACYSPPRPKKRIKNLQAQFKNRTIQKRYIALLEGEVPQDEGEIRLPLCPDPLDRPRQIVSEEFGKPAFTRYRYWNGLPEKPLSPFIPKPDVPTSYGYTPPIP